MLDSEVKSDSSTLLLVDDDQVFCNVMAKSLRKRRFRVETASSQNEAREKLLSLQPGYAIVDLRIGRDSGLNVIADLVGSIEDIKIVVLTGFASIATAVEAIKLGAVHYLTKPAEIDDILRAFDHVSDCGEDVHHHQPMSARRLEWEHLQKVVQDYDGNISAAARAMGMHRRTLQRKLAKKPVRH